MTNSEEVEFNHLLNEFFGVGSPIYQYCIHYKIKFHRKLRAKLKNGDELEYVDETGPKITCPLDITEFSHDDFMFYLTYDYDEDSPDKYSNKQANESLAARERRAAAFFHLR